MCEQRVTCLFLWTVVLQLAPRPVQYFAPFGCQFLVAGVKLGLISPRAKTQFGMHICVHTRTQAGSLNVTPLEASPGAKNLARPPPPLATALPCGSVFCTTGIPVQKIKNEVNPDVCPALLYRNEWPFLALTKKEKGGEKEEQNRTEKGGKKPAKAQMDILRFNVT